MPEKSRKSIENIASRTTIYICIITILLIIICIYEVRFIIPALVLYVGIIYYSIMVARKRNSEISSHIQELVLDVDSAAKRTLINSPFPLIILETNGNIIWRSSKFANTFMNIDINTYLDGIVKEVNNEILSSKKDKNEIAEKNITIGNNKYKILGEYVKSKKRDKKHTYMMTLYFINITEQEKMLKEYNDTKNCMRNNYDR